LTVYAQSCCIEKERDCTFCRDQIASSKCVVNGYPNLCHSQINRNWKRLLSGFLFEREILKREVDFSARDCLKLGHKGKAIKMCIAPILPLALFCSVLSHGTTTPISECVIRTLTSVCMPVFLSETSLSIVLYISTSIIVLWSKYMYCQNQEIRCTISSDVITLYIPLYHALHNPLHCLLSRLDLYEI